jgi:hypothetical protein
MEKFLEKSKSFLPLVFAQVLHRIQPQIESILTACFVEADAHLLQNVRCGILRVLIIFSELSNFTPRQKCFLKSHEGALATI